MNKKIQFPEMMNTEQAARYIGIDTGTCGSGQGTEIFLLTR